MKKIMAIFLIVVMLLGCVPAFAAGNMSSWFESSTAQTMQIIDADENMMAFDERINPIKMLYGIYNLRGEADIDLSNVEAPFSDMNMFEPYSSDRKAITWLYLKGVLKGYPDGTIKPRQQIFRAEFLAMLVRMLEKTNSIRISTGNTNPYNDVNGHWAYDEIIKATSMGLVQGDGVSFNPDSWITKEEVITIGLRLADKMEVDINDYADIIDEIYDVTIDYPIYTDGWGQYDYSQYDYIINVGDYENIYFSGINTISSYTTSKTGIVTVSKYSSYLKVTGQNEGVVTLTAKSSSGYQRAVKILVVNEYGNNTDSYTVRVGSTQKVYHPNRTTIRSYSITSGSSYITVTKYNNYLSVKGVREGTAKIKITDTYGVSYTVTVRANSSYSSSNYDDYYYANKGETIRVYPASGRNISSYSITSGSSRISVTKYTSYLAVYCSSTGTATIRITDNYGVTETKTIDIDSSYYDEYEYGYDYGLTDTYNLSIGQYKNIYFDYIGSIKDYDVSKSGIVSISKYSDHIYINPKSAGTVTITVYDYNGNSERVRITVESNYYEDEYDYGVTATKSIYNNNRTKIYFYNLDGDLIDYDVSKTGILKVDLYDDYIAVEGYIGRTGTVTITVYDEYGSSEAVKLYVYNPDNYEDDSQPPYRDVIYPPDYEVDISK